MRIAYIAPYQGPDLLKRRPIIYNRSIASDIKIELTSRLLFEKSNTVEIISQGEVVKSGIGFYPAFVETQRFHREIPVHYTSALTIRFITGFWEEMRALRLFKRLHKASPFDAVIIYNTKRAQRACANYALKSLRLPVLLDYEDDAFVGMTGEKSSGLKAAYDRQSIQRLFRRLSGCFAVSPYLLSQLPSEVPKLLVRGIVDPAIINARPTVAKKNWVAFAGTHSKPNGVGLLIDAWKAMKLPDWELHIAGSGEETAALKESAQGRPDIIFHGVLRGSALADFLCSSKICVSPNETSSTPGHIFPCKIIDYMAAGAHVIAVRMGPLEKELENGLTYIPSNKPQVIAEAMQQVIQERRWERSEILANLVCDKYGAPAVADALVILLQQALSAFGQSPEAAKRLIEKVS
jgi:glycosyltransferase involved in cell wall biosynthesis